MRVTRRQALAGFGLASGAALSGRRAYAQMESGTVARRLPAANICLLAPQTAEGPYYLDPGLIRSDISEDRAGVPLELLLQVVDAGDYAALAGVRVDVWHADAAGHYSGFQGQGDARNVSTEARTFLRGTQLTDADGEVAFSTIYPGWYAGRTPHIHFKVFVGRKEAVTGQIYFPDALSEYLYTTVPPYNRRGRRDTTNDRDWVLQAAGGNRQSFCAIKEEANRYAAALIVGIDRDGRAPSATGSETLPSGAGRRGRIVPGA